MGARQSVIPYDESTFAYEVAEPEPEIWRFVHVTWATTPQRFKDFMKAEVRKHLPSELATVDRVTLPHYHAFIRRGSMMKKPLSVSFKHAIVEVLQEMGISRKYTIHWNKRYWNVLFVQG